MRESAGGNVAAIEGTVTSFRNDLGTLNANTAGSKDTGRREIDWDDISGANDKATAVAPDTYNTTSPRGVFLLGPAFRVSENPGPIPTLPNGLGGYANFSSIRASYATSLPDRFSGDRLFTPFGTTTTGVLFLLPGSLVPARVSGFGAVFSDVDGPGTKIDYYDAAGALLHSQPVPAQNNGLSFVGVSFSEGAVVAAVAVTSGTAPLAAGNADAAATDIVALDDFIYGEPNDGDGRASASDNCPLLFNPDQKDTDGDGQGDACDADDDNDGTPDANDGVPTNGGETGDLDGDGIGDNADPDDDGDGLPDELETYFGLNPRSADSDGDGRLDSADNCPTKANADQADGNRNGKGDACDPLDKAAPKVTKVKLRSKKWKRKKGTTLSLTLDEPAAIAISFEIKKGRRYKKLKPQLELLGRRGSNTISVKRLDFDLFAVGTYRYTILTADGSNNVSKPVRGTFKVVR